MIPGARTFVLGIPRLAAKREVTMAYLSERGISAEKFDAVDFEVSGLITKWTYERDNPGTNFNIGPKLVNLALAHVLAWNVCLYLENDSFVFLEDDVRFDAEWKGHFDDAVNKLPGDWDLLHIGSCCTDHHRGKRQIHNRLWETAFALCTHAYAIRKKALPDFISGCARIHGPIDIAMAMDVAVPLKRYSILPRIAHQLDTVIPP